MRLSFQNNSWIKHVQHWEKSDNNWNVVCWSSLAVIGLTVLSDQKERDYFIKKAFKNTRFFLNSIHTDGYFIEGSFSFYCFFFFWKLLF